MGAWEQARDMVKPAKAKLVVLGNNVPDTAKSLEFMFNPTKYELSRRVGVSRATIASKPAGKAQYKGTGPLILSMELLFDDFGSASGDVTPKVDTLLKWQQPTAKSGKRPAPPLIGFVWGNKQLARFQGVLTKVAVTYTLFRKDGTPIQARVNISIDGEETVAALGNPTSHAIDSSRVHMVTAGDSLQSIAWKQLGDAGYWRAVAELNGIDDPLRVAPGQVLLIPTTADAARKA